MIRMEIWSGLHIHCICWMQTHWRHAYCNLRIPYCHYKHSPTKSEYEDPQERMNGVSERLQCTSWSALFLVQGAYSSTIKGSSTASRFSTHSIYNTLLWIHWTNSSTRSTKFTMQIITTAFFLFTAMNAVATPIESQQGSVDARDDLVTGFMHSGVRARSPPVLWYH